MGEEGSDKSDLFHNHHNYTVEYCRIFDHAKERVENVFELGLGTNNEDVKSSMGKSGIPGASLRGWRRYFPKANIYGADIDKRILFNEDRIKTYYVDQTSSSDIENLWREDDLKDVYMDIIIDDGLHEHKANINFFKNSFHKLVKGGVYIIEDVVISEIYKYQSDLESLKDSMGFIYEIRVLQHPKNRHDNCLIVIKKVL